MCIDIMYAALLAIERGWLHFLQFFEVFEKSENFSVCIFWDVVFHLNVALNEELPVTWCFLHF